MRKNLRVTTRPSTVEGGRRSCGRGICYCTKTQLTSYRVFSQKHEKYLSITTRAYSLFSAEAYTTPEPTLFFFRRRLLLVRFVCSAPGKVSPRKVDLSRATATWPRGLVRWQVPPERHMRIVFTCCSLSRSPNFVAICNPAEPAWKGGKAAKLVDETPFSTRSPHTTRTFVSIAPRFAISFLP